MRGYFGIGIYQPKNKENIGTLWRSAFIFGASFIFTIGHRYKKQCSDTVKAYRHIPLWTFDTYAEFKDKVPYTSRIICIENSENADNLSNFVHPHQCVYLLGSEDHGLPEPILSGNQTIIIPSKREFCLNVSTSGSIVMFDRLNKEQR